MIPGTVYIRDMEALFRTYAIRALKGVCKYHNRRNNTTISEVEDFSTYGTGVGSSEL